MKYFDLKEEPKTKRSHQSQESPPSSSLPSSKTNLCPIGSSGSDSALYDVILEVKAGSRRSLHVPLVSLMSKLNGKAVIGHPLSVEALSDGKSNVLTSSLARDTFLARPQGEAETAYRNQSNKQPKDQQFSSRKSKKRRKHGGALSKKMQKLRKHGGLLSKKMRKLSSLTGKKGRSKPRKPAGDKSVGPVVACIPVKVVFSRISEAVNGSTRSTATANKV
ncbi:hypothetical protein MLD38_030742 [Melastoma candidum]|nr:hypothetical protein MLD38_030742 [Melastoma candidum]